MCQRILRADSVHQRGAGPWGNKALDDKLMSGPFLESSAENARADEIIAANCMAASAIAALRKNLIVCMVETS